MHFKSYTNTSAIEMVVRQKVGSADIGLQNHVLKLFLGHVIILSSCVLGENMGKGINGKELGKGIRQRKDGRYETRIYNQGTGKYVSLYATNLQKLKKNTECIFGRQKLWNRRL